MGIFSYFRNRQARESALGSPEEQAAIEQAVAQAQAQSAQLQAEHAQVTHGEAVGGLAGLGVLFSQLQAAQQAGVSVETSSQMIDLRGSDLREEILGVIAAHGIDASQDGQTIDASSAEGLQSDILAVLSRAGIDVNAAAAGMPFAIVDPPGEAGDPPEPIDPTVPQIRNPLRPDRSKTAGAGPREAGGPRGPHPSLRVGSQGGMPTRSLPEAGLTGSEL